MGVVTPLKGVLVVTTLFWVVEGLSNIFHFARETSGFSTTGTLENVTLDKCLPYSCPGTCAMNECSKR